MPRENARRRSSLRRRRVRRVGGDDYDTQAGPTDANEPSAEPSKIDDDLTQSCDVSAEETGGDVESIEGSKENLTDGSASVVTSTLKASDSETSSVTTTRSAQGRRLDDIVASTSSSSNNRVARRLATKCRSKGGRKCKKVNKISSSVDTIAPAKEETIHLIRLRDDMINAKHKEVLLLSRRNQGLREGIDAVEAEMASLHGVIEDKDNAVQRLKRDTDRLRRDIKRLQVEGEEKRGEENAMEMAATQNTRLLKAGMAQSVQRQIPRRHDHPPLNALGQLLEQEELKREAVLSERDEARAQVRELKDRVRNSDEQHARRTSGLEVKLIKANAENMALREKCSGTDDRIKNMERELESTRKQATFERETAKAELSTRRQCQYENLSQLQEAGDELQWMKDRVEKKGQDLEVCRQHCAELEMRLRTVQSDMSAVERTSREREAKDDEDTIIAVARLSKEIALSESLQDKVANMGRTILRLVERHKDLQAEVSRSKAEESRLHAQIKKSNKRSLCLQQKVVRLESGLNLEATQIRLHGAIDIFNNQMKPPSPAKCAVAKRPSIADRPEEQGDNFGTGDIVWSRRQLLWKYLTYFKLVVAQGANTLKASGRIEGHAGAELDLSSCGLEDSDLDELMRMVRSLSHLASLDLSMNHIGDGAAAGIASALRHPDCNLTRVDLRGNQMSMEGVRALAKALEENTHRGIGHVYVHSEGRIDALGRRSRSTHERGDPGGDPTDPLESFVSVAVVDVRGNRPRVNVEQGPAVGRYESQVGVGRVMTRRGRGANAGVVLGGSDEVVVKPGGRRGKIIRSQAIARQRAVRDFMAKVAYLDMSERSEASLPCV